MLKGVDMDFQRTVDVVTLHQLNVSNYHLKVASYREGESCRARTEGRGTAIS